MYTEKQRESNRIYRQHNKDKIKIRSHNNYLRRKANGSIGLARKRYHKKHRDIILEKQRQRYAKNRQIWEQLLNDANLNKCIICGYNRCLDVLDYHHINPDLKEMRISRIISHCPTEERIKLFKEEINKTVTMCANCHRELHAGLITIPGAVQE